MGSGARRLRSNMYEGDILDFDSVEELERVKPLKANKAIKKSKFIEDKAIKLPAKKSTITTNPVDATCNKCSNKVCGDLIGDIYLRSVDKIMPLISYTCQSCGHIGRRSVITLALPLEAYERKYFG